MVVAAMAMIALLGAAAIVVDWGVFYVIQHEVQSAADSAALAASWYVPVCDAVNQVSAGCQTTGPSPTGVCAGTRPDSDNDGDQDADQLPCEIALEFATANLGPAVALCASYNVTPYQGGASHNPSVNIYVVSITCEARHWMGTVLPNMPLTMTITANAAATSGWRGPNGDIASSPSPPNTLITRLVSTYCPPINPECRP